MKGFDRAFGARPMARLVEKTIKKPLSDLLLFGNVKDGDRVLVDVARGRHTGDTGMKLRAIFPVLAAVRSVRSCRSRPPRSCR